MHCFFWLRGAVGGQAATLNRHWAFACVWRCCGSCYSPPNGILHKGRPPFDTTGTRDPPSLPLALPPAPATVPRPPGRAQRAARAVRWLCRGHRAAHVPRRGAECGRVQGGQGRLLEGPWGCVCLQGHIQGLHLRVPQRRAGAGWVVWPGLGYCQQWWDSAQGGRGVARARGADVHSQSHRFLQQ